MLRVLLVIAALGFDHAHHDQRVFVSGATELTCTRCHVVAKGLLVGRPDHATCFGACHGAAPKRPAIGAKLGLDQERAKLCGNCHDPAQLAAPFTGKLAVPYPPYKMEQFNVAIGHEKHAKAACTTCHAPPETKAKPSAAHARCIACHDGKVAFAMVTCRTCHPAASGKPQPPELAVPQDTVTATFSHARHAARGGKECTLCHAAIRATNDSELPRPTVKDCASCHDSKTAFATTTACTRCHATAPAKFTVARPAARFSHTTGKHAEAVQKQPCASCHPIAGNETVVAGHAACAGCHADDFGARKPKICGACHTATEPWRQLVADRAPAERTELGATIDHAKHPAACASCHSLRTETQQLRPPRGHRACTNAGCHAVKGGPAPELGACDGCHRLGLAAAREQARAADPWSVRGSFDHAAHATGRDGKPLACTACHVDLAAHDVVGLAVPPKPTCAPCHDGVYAFKLTGTTCSKCHNRASGLGPRASGDPK